MITSKKILVTGGAGSVGSHLVKALLGQNAKVTVLDDLSNGNVANLPHSNLLEFVEGSVCNEFLVQKLAREADLIYHLAARNIIASVDSPRTDFEVNVGGTINVLMAAREKGTKVVYISSADKQQ
jgi:nucleoside-diphosphate-sugar epimerase